MRLLSEVKPGLRPEIQALRAVAVTLVLVYHLWPTRLGGGFVGVDVFFVISGYLITAHICKPVTARTFRLRDFYSRRIRRLLPASLLVLFFIAIATWLFVPQSLWGEFGRQIIASAFYFENWALAANSVNYSAPAADVSPVQHFWSLSVEEQFYLAWPLLLVLSAVIGRTMRWVRAHFIAVLTAVALASFVWSLIYTAADPGSAYFSTFTRAWEFGAGGLLAVIPPAGKLPDVSRAALSWVGLAAIFGSAFTLDSATPFPGWIALVPVVGALLVMAAGMPQTRWAPSTMFRLRPIQFLGDISYSLYLWHWPIIILLPFILGRELSFPLRVAVAIASIVLAYLTRRFVEKPFIGGRPTQPASSVPGRARATAFVAVLAVAASCMVAVAAPAAAMVATSQAEIEEAQSELADVMADPPECLGGAAIVEGCDVDGTDGAPVFPHPVLAELDNFAEPNPGCQGVSGDPMFVCHFGEEGSRTRIAVVGDSHAAQWEPALETLAEEHGWELTTYLRGGCPFTVAKLETDPARQASCAGWNRQVLTALTQSRYDAVVVSARASTDFELSPGKSNAEVAADGYRTAWSEVIESGTPVLAIRDNPDPVEAGVLDVPSCVERYGRGPQCETTESITVGHDPQVAAADGLRGAHVLDLTDYFCVDGECPAVIGDVLVYRLGQHITATYSTTLAPLVEESLVPIVEG